MPPACLPNISMYDTATAQCIAPSAALAPSQQMMVRAQLVKRAFWASVGVGLPHPPLPPASFHRTPNGFPQELQGRYFFSMNRFSRRKISPLSQHMLPGALEFKRATSPLALYRVSTAALAPSQQVMGRVFVRFLWTCAAIRAIIYHVRTNALPKG